MKWHIPLTFLSLAVRGKTFLLEEINKKCYSNRVVILARDAGRIILMRQNLLTDIILSQGIFPPIDRPHAKQTTSLHCASCDKGIPGTFRRSFWKDATILQVQSIYLLLNGDLQEKFTGEQLEHSSILLIIQKFHQLLLIDNIHSCPWNPHITWVPSKDIILVSTKGSAPVQYPAWCRPPPLHSHCHANYAIRVMQLILSENVLISSCAVVSFSLEWHFLKNPALLSNDMGSTAKKGLHALQPHKRNVTFAHIRH